MVEKTLELAAMREAPPEGLVPSDVAARPSAAAGYEYSFS